MSSGLQGRQHVHYAAGQRLRHRCASCFSVLIECTNRNNLQQHPPCRRTCLCRHAAPLLLLKCPSACPAAHSVLGTMCIFCFEPVLSHRPAPCQPRAQPWFTLPHTFDSTVSRPNTGPAGSSVRELARETGADVKSWSDSQAAGGRMRPARTFLIQACPCLTISPPAVSCCSCCPVLPCGVTRWQCTR